MAILVKTTGHEMDCRYYVCSLEVDRDGKKQNSNTVLIDVSGISNAFAVYPNPARNMLHLQVTGNAVITITNGAGRTVLAKKITGNTDINLSTLAAGTYYVKNNTTGEVRQIVVAR